MGRKRIWKDKVARRKSAQERKEVREKRTNEEQLAHLDELLGEGVGAVKERARLAKKIEENRGS